MKRDNLGKFASNQSEPRTAKLSLRIEPSMLKKLESLPDWRETVRSHLAKLTKETGDSGCEL